jgi:stage II sporulation protein R
VAYGYDKANLIRFHVIANSDSAKDQALKIKVKDALVKELSPELSDVRDIEEGRALIQSKLTSIQTLAETIIIQNGYDYQVTAKLEPVYFPIKTYGEYTFPAGKYEALRVQIGEAKGKNWWCVMFPPLCFVDESYSIVESGTEDQLKCLLTEEEYESITSKKTPVKVKFKLLEAIKDIFS